MEMMELTMEDLYKLKHCPMRWKLEQIHKETPPMTEKERISENAKATIQWYYMQRMNGMHPTYAQVKERFGTLHFGRLSLDEIKQSSRVKPRRGHEVNMEQKVMKGILTLVGQEISQENEILAVGQRYRVKVSDSLTLVGDIPVVRRTKRGEVELVWLATSFAASGNPFFDLTDMGLTFMQLAWSSVQGRTADNIRVFDCVTGKERHIRRTRKDFKRLTTIAKSYEQIIRQNLIMPREQNGCTSCPKKNLCAQWTGWK